MFNFDEVPTVVGHPYEYGVPGARHGIFKEPEPVVATVGAPAEESPAETGLGTEDETSSTDGDA
jgi:cytochrome c oxidase subunit 1